MDSRGPSVRLGERWVNLPHGYYLPELADRLRLLISLPTGRLPQLDLMVADRWTSSPHPCQVTVDTLGGERETIELGRFPNVWRSYRLPSGSRFSVEVTFDNRVQLAMRLEVRQVSADEARLVLVEAIRSWRRGNLSCQ